MLQGLKKIFEGILFSLGIGVAIAAVLNLFKAALSSVLGQGVVQLSAAEGWIWARLLKPGVIGPLEITALATIAGVILLILLLILGLLRILGGVMGILSAGKTAVFGSTANPNAGRPGLAFVLGIIGTLIAVVLLTGAGRAVLGFIGGFSAGGASASVAVGGGISFNPLVLIFGALLVFGVVGFFVTLALSAVLMLRDVF